MTKEEKIAELINIRDNYNYTLAPREVFDDAIKALEQQPCEDCISRESVIEWLKDKDIIKTKNQEENARRELAELPSVTPRINLAETSQDRISILNRIMEYTYGMLTTEKIGLQHLIKSMMDELNGGGEDEVGHD